MSADTMTDHPEADCLFCEAGEGSIHNFEPREATPLSVMVQRERERIARMDAIHPLN